MTHRRYTVRPTSVWELMFIRPYVVNVTFWIALLSHGCTRTGERGNG